MAYRSFSLSGFEARGVRKVYPLVDFKRSSEKLPTPSLAGFDQLGNTVKLPEYPAKLLVPLAHGNMCLAPGGNSRVW